MLSSTEGPPLVIHSDRQWRAATEPEAGWEQTGFDDSAWVAAMELGQAGIAPWGIPWGDRWHSEHRRLPARYVRREFDVPTGKTIRRATAYVCGLGFFDLLRQRPADRRPAHEPRADRL